jgi:hypothetical protein
MFGRNPERDNLTFQPRGEFEMSREDAINAMDEMSLEDNLSTVGRDLASAWRQGQASIRDMAHAGGADSRIHLTVVSQQDGRTYHVPLYWDRHWHFEHSDSQGVTR